MNRFPYRVMQASFYMKWAEGVPENGAKAGELVQLLPADVHGGEDLDVAAELPDVVHQLDELFPPVDVLAPEQLVRYQQRLDGLHSGSRRFNFDQSLIDFSLNDQSNNSYA